MKTRTGVGRRNNVIGNGTCLSRQGSTFTKLSILLDVIEHLCYADVFEDNEVSGHMGAPTILDKDLGLYGAVFLLSHVRLRKRWSTQ